MPITDRWPHRLGKKTAVFALTLALSCADLCATALAARGDAVRPLLDDHIAPGLAKAQLVGHLLASQTLRFTVALPVRDQAALEQLVADQADPRSPRYLFYLTPAQFAEQFGAQRVDYDQTLAFLTAQGLRVTKTYPDRLHIGVEGSVQQVEQTFGVCMNRYKVGDRECIATDRNPVVPDWLRVQPAALVGLSTLARMTPCDDGSGNPNGSPPYDPAEISSAYNMSALRSAGFTGQGQTIVVFAPGNYSDSNLTSFATGYGLSASVPNVVRRNIDGGNALYEIETDVSVELLMGLAPSARIEVWLAPNTVQGNLDTFLTFVNENTIKLMNNSWSFGWEGDLSQAERDALHAVYVQAAAQGQTVVTASGDHGSTGGHFDPNTGARAVGVEYPASDPYVLCVGATSLHMTPPPGLAWQSETGWAGSGGGLSGIYDRPTWQNAAVPGLVNGQSTGKRQVPDVALNGDDLTGYRVFITGLDGQPAWVSAARTSTSTPVFAAGLALIQQAIGRNFFAPPLIYQAFANANGGAPFHDITVGNNGFACTAGWDYVTGCGSADFSGLRTAIAGQLNTGKLTGQVLDRFRQPVGSAEIHLFSLEKQVFIPVSATSDAGGLYTIDLSNVPPGHYHIGAYRSSAYNQWIFSPFFQGYTVQNGSDLGPVEIVLEDADTRAAGIFGFVRYDDATGAHPIGSGVHIDVYSGGHLVASTDSLPNGTYSVGNLQAKLNFWGFNTFIATWTDPKGVARKSVGVNFGTWPGVNIRTDVVFTIP